MWKSNKRTLAQSCEGLAFECSGSVSEHPALLLAVGNEVVAYGIARDAFGVRLGVASDVFGIAGRGAVELFSDSHVHAANVYELPAIAGICAAIHGISLS